MGHPTQQDRITKFSGICEILPRFQPLARKIGCPITSITGNGNLILWGEVQQQASYGIKVALIEGTALAQPGSEGEFALDTLASDMALSGFLLQWQGYPYNGKLRPIVFGSKKLTPKQDKYGAAKLEMYAAYYFLKNPEES